MRVHRFADLPDELRAEISSGKVSGLLCPMCNGGRSGERSLSAGPTGAGTFHLHCHRAGCSYSARIFGDVNLDRPSFKRRVYEGELCPTELCDNLSSVLQVRYQLNDSTIERFTRAAPTQGSQGALYLPVLSPTGAERGGIMRYFDGTEPKAVSYKQTDEPWQAWYVQTEMLPAEIVITEDQISAMRCWQLGFHAVALLGTNLNHEKAREIGLFQLLPPKVLLALDKDAWPQAMKFARKYSWLKPILLERDLKDISDEEIEERLDG